MHTPNVAGFCPGFPDTPSHPIAREMSLRSWLSTVSGALVVKAAHLAAERALQRDGTVKNSVVRHISLPVPQPGKIGAVARLVS